MSTVNIYGVWQKENEEKKKPMYYEWMIALRKCEDGPHGGILNCTAFCMFLNEYEYNVRKCKVI